MLIIATLIILTFLHIPGVFECGKVLGIFVLTLISLCCEVHNGFIEGYQVNTSIAFMFIRLSNLEYLQVVIMSTKTKKAGTVSGLIAFCANVSSIGGSVTIGALSGAYEAGTAWKIVFHLILAVGILALIVDIISYHLESLSQRNPSTPVVLVNVQPNTTVETGCSQTTSGSGQSSAH